MSRRDWGSIWGGRELEGDDDKVSEDTFKGVGDLAKRR